MNRSSWLALPFVWAGATLILSSLRSTRRLALVDRLQPTLRPRGASAAGRPARQRPSLGSLRAVMGPLAADAATRLSTVLGLRDETERRLRRIGSPDTLVDVRVRQLAHAVIALTIAIVAANAVDLPVVLALVVIAGAPLLAVLLVEQRLAAASNEWQRRLTLELPVVAEQLGMLLSSGSSLSGAISRLGQRTSGVFATGLAGVTRRIRQGVGEIEALREWAELADVRALDRLVGVLALNREATDLGALIAVEARAARDQVHRDLLELIDRRGQQVWIPVTVATLVPGVIFMAVPFLDAMRQLTGG